ncbi:MAG: IS21-like element helper ATPase IstB [Saprospiraceae bacterium]
MNTQATLDQLFSMHLSGMARQYESILQLPTHQHPDAHSLVASLADAEQQYRSHAKIQLYLRLSKLRYPATLEQIAYAAARNLSKDQVIPLADCTWIDRAENILLAGPTGSGKSYLACAIGHQACIMGYRTLYFNMNRFTDKIMLAKLDGSFTKLLNQLEKIHLLVLDDFGLAPMDQNTRLALLQILEDRYGLKSVLIASQLPIAAWYDYIAEPTLADAILDRLLNNAHRFELKGESLRKKSSPKSQ